MVLQGDAGRHTRTRRTSVDLHSEDEPAAAFWVSAGNNNAPLSSLCRLYTVLRGNPPSPGVCTEPGYITNVKAK